MLLAPGGYGKSIAASQIARLDVFDDALWIDCSWISDAEAQFPILFGAHDASELASGDYQSAVLAPSQRESIWSVLSSFFAAAQGLRICVVLDSLNASLPVPQIEALVHLLRREVHPDAAVIVTSRDTEAVRRLGIPVLTIGVEDLEFSLEDTACLADLLRFPAASSSALVELRRMSCGQAALIGVLLRHARDKEELHLDALRPTADLAVLLARLAQTQLTAQQNALLAFCALLRNGTLLDVQRAFEHATLAEMRGVSEALPLFRVEGRGIGARFDVHDLLRCAVIDVENWPVSCDEHLEQALRALDECGRVEQLFDVLLHRDQRDIAATWLERRGFDLLERGGLGLLSQLLEVVGPAALVRSPTLLLLQAQMLRETFELEAALRKAALAENLASCVEDSRVCRDAVMTQARVLLDMGRLDAAAGQLERSLSFDAAMSSPDTELLAHAYLAMCYASTGNLSAMESHSVRASALLGDACSAESEGRAIAALAGIEGLVRGRWDEVARIDQSFRASDRISHFLRLQIDGNRGTYLCELGRLREARELLLTVVEECRSSGIRSLEWVYRGSLALVLAGEGDYIAARSLLADAVSNLEKCGEEICTVQGLAYGACVARADRRFDESLLLAERAIESGAMLPFGWISLLSGLELGYSLMAVGDVAGAAACAAPLAAQAAEVGAEQSHLLADLLLAEAACRDSRRDVPDLRRHCEYVQTGSANWRLLQVLRTFPSAFLALMEAVGVDQMPVRLLRMLRAEDWAFLKQACSLDLTSVQLAMQRVGGSDARETIPSCRVRLFGGLDVRVGDRAVRERDWRKRKARILFAMMVLQRGRDLSREQICDLLWPELDAVRARNNFYVIWSIMKGALAPDAGRGAKLEFADNTGGLCRIDVERVESDVEQFARTISAARLAESEQDWAGALERYVALLDIYRGELLPGDIYDDCFSAARDRYRIEFCDAMRRAVTCTEALGRIQDSLRFARAGLDADPLSEDLYRAVMRCHIEAGERSAAIDAYFTCRQRLCDDLGLDPCSETMRLYEQILAMDEAGLVDPDTPDTLSCDDSTDDPACADGSR